MEWLSCPNAKYSDRLLGAGSVYAVLRIAILVVFIEPEDSLPPNLLLVYMQFMESKSMLFLSPSCIYQHVEE